MPEYWMRTKIVKKNTSNKQNAVMHNKQRAIKHPPENQKERKKRRNASIIPGDMHSRSMASHTPVLFLAHSSFCEGYFLNLLHPDAWTLSQKHASRAPVLKIYEQARASCHILAKMFILKGQ
jgi:hypothetical protein